MSDWQVIFLGVMAVALVVMAATQVLVSLTLLRATRQVTESVAALQRDLRPLIDKATKITDDAARVTALALTQVERIDRLVGTLSVRVEETFGIVQEAIVQPMKQGAAFMAAFRAVIGAIREWQGRSAAPRDDEDPLFVG